MYFISKSCSETFTFLITIEDTAEPRSHAPRGNAVRTLRVRECLKGRDTDHPHPPGRGASGLHSHAERGNEAVVLCAFSVTSVVKKNFNTGTK
ncbi:MAG: hypothetical protein GY749_01615 [Desulfobacteraceae bacterium]|nr:hypothetical protein [Desulfobacteraceae bacterium]